jgi:hypothetical protein
VRMELDLRMTTVERVDWGRDRERRGSEGIE